MSCGKKLDRLVKVIRKKLWRE